MKSPLQVEDAPKAIGPYTQAQVVRLHGGQKLVYSSGQVGLDPKTGDLVPGGIQAETRAMLENVGRLLDAVGLTFADVVKCTVYLRDFADFGAMNTVYREFFQTDAPTRATVGVTALAADYSIEIEVMAAR